MRQFVAQYVGGDHTMASLALVWCIQGVASGKEADEQSLYLVLEICVLGATADVPVHTEQQVLHVTTGQEQVANVNRKATETSCLLHATGSIITYHNYSD